MAKEPKKEVPQDEKELKDFKEVEKPSLELPPEEAIVELLENATEEAKPVIIQALLIARSHYRGPIPPSDEFEKYNRVLPGAADRILSKSEKEQDFRHRLEEKEQDFNHRQDEKFQDHQIKQSNRTQWMAFVLVIMSMGFGILCVQMEALYIAGILFSTTIATILGTLGLRFLQKKEKKE